MVAEEMKRAVKAKKELRVVYSITTNLGSGGLGVDGFEAARALYHRGYLKRVLVYGNGRNEIPGAAYRRI